MSVPLPNLVVAGVTKAGTTSLHAALAQHPDIAAAAVKEIDHFAPLVHGAEPPPLADYAQHFAGAEAAAIRLETSPRYFIGGPALVDRLAEDLREPRVLIALREPVSRMWSSYAYKRSKGRLPAGMDYAAFVEQCARVSDDGSLRRPGSAAFRTLGSGVYSDFLPDWWDRLGERVEVVFFDDLRSPEAELSRLCRWLGLDAAPVAGFDLQVRNQTHQPRSRLLKTVAQRAGTRLRGTPAERVLRSAYHRVNATTLDERPAEETTAWLQEFYAPSRARLCDQLEARGRSGLPGWVGGAVG